MSDDLQTTRRALHGVLTAAIAAGLALLAGVAPAAAAPVSAGERAGSKSAVLKHWSPERMRRAEPLTPPAHAAPLPAPAGTTFDAPPAPAPRVIPPTEPLGPAGPLSASAPVAGSTAYPLRTHGKLFGRMKGFGPYECSATVVSSPAATTVLTAGHCVKEPGGPWASKLLFVPAYFKGKAPFGRWVGREVWVDRKWARRGSSNFDVATLQMRKRGGAAIEDAVGARGLIFDGPVKQSYGIFGYPLNKAKGKRPWGCETRFSKRDPLYAPPGPRPIGARCDMGPGASGGAWVTADGLVSSVTAFLYLNRRKVIYGPYLSGAAEKLWLKAGRA